MLLSVQTQLPGTVRSLAMAMASAVRRIQRAAPDSPFTGFVAQLLGETGADSEQLPQPGASLVDDGALRDRHPTRLLLVGC